MIGEYFVYTFDFNDKKIFDILKPNYEVFSNHIDYLKNVKELGKLVIAGITQQREIEIILLNVQDEKLAEAIFLNDPLKKSNSFCYNYCNANISLLSTTFLQRNRQHYRNEEIMENYKKTKTNFFISFLRKNKNIDKLDFSASHQSILEAHSDYVKAKFHSNNFIITGLIIDEDITNFILIHAKDINEATLLLRNNPAIAKKLFDFEVLPFNILLVG